MPILAASNDAIPSGWKPGGAVKRSAIGLSRGIVRRFAFKFSQTYRSGSLTKPFIQQTAVPARSFPRPCS